MRRVRLLALLLAAVLLLSGCSPLTAERDGYVSMVPFDEMEYARPDLDAALADADDLIASLGRGMKLRDATGALDQLFTEFYHMRTMETLATIRSDSDVTDAFYSAEYAFCSDAVITFRGKLEEVFAACAASDLKDDFSDYFGEGFLDDYGEDYVYPERLFELQKQENELVNRYYNALAAQRLTIGGVDYTLDDLLYADQDGAMPGDLTIEQAVDQYYDMRASSTWHMIRITATSRPPRRPDFPRRCSANSCRSTARRRSAISWTRRFTARPRWMRAIRS